MNALFLIAMLSLVGEASATPPMPASTHSDEDSDAIHSTDYDGRHSSLRSTRVDVTEKELENTDSTPLAETTFTDQEYRTLSSKRCNGDEQELKIDLSTDAYGFENSWRLLKNTANGPKELYSGPPADKKYDKTERYLGVYCLSPGTYKFVINDLFEDGMCCSFGQGKYAGYVGNTKIFSSPNGDENWEKRSHLFKIASSSNTNLPLDPKIGTGMTARDNDWLGSHNSRRKRWHERYGKRYVPLKWSQALVNESKIWAEKLANDCDLEHDPNTIHGENIALNYGWGSTSGMRPTDNILSRFVEDEADDRYPDCGHLTQVLWRATKYVGCADASRPYDGGRCHAQVCRYTRPGNCNMSKYKSNKSEWWLTPMLMDESACGRECPPDGCN